MRILMISSTFPYPPSQGGTEIRTFNLLRYLHQHHQVTLITQLQEEVRDADVEVLKEYVEDLAVFPIPNDKQIEDGLLGKIKRFGTSLVQGKPPNVLHRYSPEIQAWVDSYVQAGKCDAITCEHSVNAVYVRPEFRQSVLTVVNIHSLGYAVVRKELEMGASKNPLRDRLYLSLQYRYEKRFAQQFSRMIATTEDDRLSILQLCPDTQVEVIPNGVDLDIFPYRSHDPNGTKLIFIGAMDVSHNIDAVKFFCLEVLPRIQQRYPDTTFTIVGARATPEVLALGKQPGVNVVGRVPSMAEYLHQATVCVVPLRVGFGIKNKTLEAMAAGVPVVGSDRGLEGLTIDGNVPLRALRANQVEEYVEAISRLFEEPLLREQLSKNGRSLIETEYTWEQAGKLYNQLLSN